MKSSQIRFIFVLATLCTIGIIGTQIYGVRRAYVHENQRFDQNVTVSLRDVAIKVWELKQTQYTSFNVVTKLSDDYYIVKINENVEEGVLEHFLKEKFTTNGVYADFVFGLHDCLNHNFKFERFVSMSNFARKPVAFKNFPDPKLDNYYFVVYFPYRTNYLSGQLTIWLVSSIILLATLAFLAYVIFVILNQKRLSEIQKDFIKNMTHEFKTPLTSIQLAATVLKSKDIVDKPTKLYNYAAIIETEARKLELQVERVLQMSMSHKKELSLNRHLIDLREVIAYTANAFKQQLEARNVELILENFDKPLMFFGDSEQLRIVFCNLLDNAIKYSKEDEKLVVRILYEHGKKDEIIISVKDNGLGIKHGDVKHIFDRFYRVSTGNIHNVKGFGIGLNYVQSIIELHGGTISCESAFGEGSTFIIYLPKTKNVG